MPSAGENRPLYNPPQTQTLDFLRQRQRSRLQAPESLHSRSRSLQSHDVARPDGYGERLARLSARELAKFPKSAPRYPPSNPISSPLLSALGSTTATAAQYTSDWAKSLPFFSSPSGPNYGLSPPTASPHDVSAPSTADSRTPPSMRPSSHPNQAATFGGRLQLSPQGRDRRQSMYARYGASSPMSQVPLPHQDQAHFHPGGLPDLDSLIPLGPREGGLIPGELGYYCGFDTLATCGHPPSVSAENVLIVGYEGGLCVYRLTNKHAEPIGKLEGLNGGVVGAKILPWTSRADPNHADRPHIALILHGPQLESNDAHHSSNDSEAVSSDDQDSPASSQPPAGNKETPAQSEIIKSYQTTVEVYSLLTKTHVATLFTSTAAEVTYASDGDFRIPGPIGDLSLSASGKYLTVSSGVSGEVLVFSPSITKLEAGTWSENYRCIGKLWTSVQRRESSEEEPTSPTLEPPLQRGEPILSLSNRWLAIVPPSTSAAFSINGTVALSQTNPRPPGILSVIPPAPPTTTVMVDTPDPHDFMGRFSREMMQGTLKAAHWVGKQSAQAWNAYWNQGQPQPTSTDGARFGGDPQAQKFPPTHGYIGSSPHAVAYGMPQVAIYDLQRMLDAEEKRTKNALTPLGTFELPSSCSFLSFSPDGLHILTVSSKGDEQCLWSLMRLYKARNFIDREFPGQYVQQVWKSVRTTVATVVDVAWSSPNGNRCAILTAKGTIHVHEIPQSAYQWPLFRRARRVKEQQTQSPSDENTDPMSPDSRWTSTMKTINGTATWLKSVRTKGISAGVSIRDLTLTPGATAVVGGKAVKAGFTKGFGVLANSAGAIYHASDNKLYIENLPDGVKPGLMRFLTGKDSGNLAVVVGSTIRICQVGRTSTPQRGRAPIVRAKISKRGKHFRLPLIPDDLFAPAVVQLIRARYGEERTKPAADTTGFWALRAPRVAYNQDPLLADNWHAQMEAETSPPYIPFHSDRRTALFAVAEPPGPPEDPSTHDACPDDGDAYADALQQWRADTLEPWLRTMHHVDDDSAWAFGELDHVATERLSAGSASVLENSGSGDAGEAMENEVRLVPAVDGGAEQVVIMTTVYRKARPAAAAGAAGDGPEPDTEFFEDGCEVLDWADDRV